MLTKKVWMRWRPGSLRPLAVRAGWSRCARWADSRFHPPDYTVQNCRAAKKPEYRNNHTISITITKCTLCFHINKINKMNCSFCNLNDKLSGDIYLERVELNLIETAFYRQHKKKLVCTILKGYWVLMKHNSVFSTHCHCQLVAFLICREGLSSGHPPGGSSDEP